MNRIMLLLTVGMNSFVWGSTIADVVEQTSKKFVPTLPTVQSIFTTVSEEKKSKRGELEQELNKLKEKEKQFSDAAHDQTEHLKGQIDYVKEQLRRYPYNEFLEKKLTLLNDHAAIVREHKKVYEKLVATYEKNLKLHDAYLADPQFKQLDKDLGLDNRNDFTLEQFQDISQRIQDQEKILSQLNEQKKNVLLEFETRKQDVDALAAQRKKKIEEVQGFFEFDVRQQEELTNLETKLEQDRRAFTEMRKAEVEQRKELIKMEIFLAESNLERLRAALKTIKPKIKVQEATITYAQNELAKRRQLFFDAQEAYDQRIEIITQRQKEIEKALTSLVEQTSITLGPDLDDWSREPVPSAQGYFEFFEVASLNTSVLLLQRQREFIESQRVLGDRVLKEEAIYLDIKKTFQRLLAHKFTPDEVAQEKKKYDGPKSRAKADELSFAAQKGEAEVHLEHQKKALVNIANKRQTLRTQRSIIFKSRTQEYTRCLELLNEAEARIKRQIDLIIKSIATFVESSLLAGKTIKHIDVITAELESEVMWSRSAHAVSWEGIKKAWPDTVRFGREVRAYAARMQPSSLLTGFGAALADPAGMVLPLLLFLLLFGFFLLVHKCLRILIPLFEKASRQQPIIYAFCMLAALFCEYFSRHFWYWAAWVTAFLIADHYAVSDPYVLAVFYLASIPYFLFLSYRFVRHVAYFNVRHNYIFLSSSVQRQVLLILATLLYVSSVLILFREAFLLGAQYESELPAILLAANVIAFQIALIFLLAKVIEQISSAIPTKTERLAWFRSSIDRYYYLILIVLTAIMVMSNPSVGFGNLVVYVLGRLVITIIVVLALLVLHRFLKYISSLVFFYSENAIVRDRFAHAKTWYGLFVITIFLAFISLGCIFIAKVWGWPEQIAAISRWSDILSWLRTPIMFEKTAEAPISVFSILELIGFFLIGVIVSIAINRVVFEKIFDVLMVDSGAQNAITSIASYLIVALATIFGFQAVGRGDLVVWVLGAFVIGLGWVIKDPVGDFIAYFIILVQRPIKIGDYIRIDDTTMGIVRKITPRAVVVRRRNSTMIIIPNTTIINRPLTNWNYQRGFVAFDDIIIRVSFKEDPHVVKSILERVLEENSFVLKSPRPVVRLDEFSEYGYLFMARGYISSNYTLEMWDIASDIRLALVRELQKQGIQIATATRIMIDKEGAVEPKKEA